MTATVKQVFWSSVLALLALTYPRSGACRVGDLIDLKWVGANAISAKVTNVGPDSCVRGAAYGTCNPYAAIITDVNGESHKVESQGLDRCFYPVTAKQCWEGKTATFTAIPDKNVKILVQKVVTGKHDPDTLESVGAIPQQPTTCSTETTTVTLLSMAPGEVASRVMSDNIRVRCNTETDLRLSLLTPTITYTPGAVSTITVPTKVRLNGNVATGVPITIKTRVDPNDVVAGSYTQSIVLKMEHD